MDEILHTPREESSAIRPPLAQLRDRWEAGTAALAQRVEPLRRRLDAATAGGRRLINPLHFLAAAVVIGVAAVVGTVYTPSYVVEVDGVALGTVTSPSVFEDVVDRVESRATDILGYDYTMDGAVTYAPALTERESITPVADFETYLFDQIGEVMKSYVLTVNGQFIGAAQDRETLNGVLEQVKAAYVDENTVSAEFTSGVYITHEYTPSDVNQDPAAMLATLTANTNGQTTYEVQKGDTFMQIAFDNDMSMSELEALNPDVDINRIYIGQLLNVKEEIPFLSVKTVDNVTYTESIECPVVEVQDDSMYQGESKVLDAGVPGEQIVNADIAYLNGVEQERTVLSTQVTREATNKVIAVGTKVRPSWLPNGYFIWPYTGALPPTSATAPSLAPTATTAALTLPPPTAPTSRPPMAAPWSSPAGPPAACGATAIWSSWITATGSRPTTATAPASWFPPATRSTRVSPSPRWAPRAAPPATTAISR